jgi:hypothetical protein
VDGGKYASLNAAVTAIGSTPATLTIKTANYPMTGPVTIPATLAINVILPGSINQGSYTLTINSPTDLFPLTRLFNGSGTVTGIKEPSPEWWGAVAYNDGINVGSVNSAPAIQAAIYSMSTAGDQYHAPVFQSGRYRCDSGLAVPEGVQISGKGIYKTIFDFSHASANTVGFQVYTSNSTYGFPPVFQGIGIGTSSNGTAIDAGGMSGLFVDHVWFSGVYGLKIPGSADMSITHNVFETVQGIIFTPTLQSNNFDISHNFFSGEDVPITLKNVKDVRIIDNDFRETRGVDIKFDATSTLTQDIKVSHNQFYNYSGMSAPGQLNIQLGGTVSDVDINNNYFEGAKDRSIYSASSIISNIKIFWNTFKSIAHDAIYFDAVGVDLTIDNNIFESSIGGQAIHHLGPGGTGNNSYKNNTIRAANDNHASGDTGAAIYLANMAYANFAGNIVTAPNATEGSYISVPAITFSGNYTTKGWGNVASAVVEQTLAGNRNVYVTAMPTLGTWSQGDKAINLTPTVGAPAGYWLRVTTGSNNVLNTDWIAK